MSAFYVFVCAFCVVSVSVVGWEKMCVLHQEPLSFVILLSSALLRLFGLRLLSFLCLFWLCFARVSRSLNKNGLKIFECFAFCLIWYKRLSCVCFVLIFVFGCLLCFGSAWFGVKGSAVSVLCLFLFLCACFRFYSYKLFMTVLGWFCVCRCSAVNDCLLLVLV